MLVGVCAVSAAGFGVFLILGGVLGRSCGRHGNFSSILDNVVDHSDSWDGGYPLGYWIVGNASFPLTVGGVVNSCRGNLSLYESLQLSVRLDLSSISFSDQVSVIIVCIIIIVCTGVHKEVLNKFLMNSCYNIIFTYSHRLSQCIVMQCVGLPVPSLSTHPSHPHKPHSSHSSTTPPPSPYTGPNL